MHTSDEFWQMYSHVTTTTIKIQNIVYLCQKNLHSAYYEPGMVLSSLQVLIDVISVNNFWGRLSKWQNEDHMQATWLQSPQGLQFGDQEDRKRGSA